MYTARGISGAWQNAQEYTGIVIEAQRPQGKPKEVSQYIAERYRPYLGGKRPYMVGKHK